MSADAVRLVRAGLQALADAVSPDHPEIVRDLLALRNGSASLADPGEATSPVDSTPRPWSDVSCGDSVLAPNGTWYRVVSVARIGDNVRALLTASDGTAKIPTTRSAADPVPVRRGDVGRAIDLFATHGIDLIPIG